MLSVNILKYEAQIGMSGFFLISLNPSVEMANKFSNTEGGDGLLLFYL